MSGLSAGKRWAFALIVAGGVWLFVELASFLALRVIDGRFSDLAEWRTRRREILGRAADRVSGARAPPGPVDHHAVHPYVGYVFDPTARAPRDASGQLGRPVSSWGYDDAQPPFHTRSDDTLIVAVVGGSVARFLSHDASDRLARGLQRAARFAGRRVVLVWLALDGYKQPQQLLTISYLLSQGAAFDVVVNLDGFNEVALPPRENVPQGVHPSYPRAWPLRVEGTPDPVTRRTMGRIAFLRDLRRDLAGAYADSLLEHSFAANLLWRAADSQLQQALRRADETLRHHRPDARRYTVTGPPRRSSNRKTLYRELVAIWHQSSLQLERLCRANDIEYYHFLQPNQYVPDSHTFSLKEGLRAYWKKSPYRGPVEKAYPLLAESGRELAASGVRFRDLRFLFRDVDGPVYRDDCCHLTPLGNEALADAIAAFVASGGEPQPRAPNRED